MSRIKRKMARVTGLEPATFGVTGRHSNQLSYTRTFFVMVLIVQNHERVIKLNRGKCQAHLSTFLTKLCHFFKRSTFFHFLEFFACTYQRKRLNGTPQWAISSVGRALRLHRRCQEFESLIAHHCFLLHKSQFFYSRMALRIHVFDRYSNKKAPEYSEAWFLFNHVMQR